MKKIISYVLVFLVSVFSIVNVNADTTKGSITINSTIVNETYKIYKVLELETYDKVNNHYIYRANSNWESFLNDANFGGKYLTVQHENGDDYYVWKEGASAKEFSEIALKYANDNGISETKKATATSTQVVFDNLDLGYYLVDSSLGSLCNLTTTNPNATIVEKNTVIPKLKKEVKEDSTGGFGKVNDATISDTVEFRSTITTGAGYKNYVLYDLLSNGLTLQKDSFKVYIEKDNTKTLVDASNYNVNTTSTNDYTFTVTFKNDFIALQPNSTKLVVYYNATLNKDAVVEGNGNPNETYLKYGDNNKTEKDSTVTYTYAFDLKKTNKENTLLDGAEFKLEDKSGNEIKVVLKDAVNNIYRVAVDGETGVLIKAGSATIEGLDRDSYLLEEITNPVGYNKLTSPEEIKINGFENDTYERVSISVINYTGTELPETGGIGTALFITCGSILVIGFGLLLVTKLRLYKENI